MRPALLTALLAPFVAPAAEDFLPGARRIVFLGDSITHAGHYVDQFAAFLAVRAPEREVTVLGLGLPSETVSGLSEPGHANGKFPRPDLHERLERVLGKTKPDLVFACYGMNDGIYQPLSEERFAAFRSGIERLRAAVLARGARIVHLTPPVFDAEPIRARTDPVGTPGRQFTGYDEVLARYAAWLVERRADGWEVIDLHTTMRQILDARRAAQPGFTFATDGVHPTEAAHWIFSMELVGTLAGPDRPAAMKTMEALRGAPDFVKLVRERDRLLTEAWLADIGHLRPGLPRGLPVAEAEARAAALAPRLREAAIALAGSTGRKL